MNRKWFSLQVHTKRSTVIKNCLKVFASLSIMRECIDNCEGGSSVQLSALPAVRDLQHHSCRGGLQAPSDHWITIIHGNNRVLRAGGEGQWVQHPDSLEEHSRHHHQRHQEPRESFDRNCIIVKTEGLVS